jgi:hypothetical protein
MHLVRLGDGTALQPAGKPYPTDVADDVWAVVAPYLALMTAAPTTRQQ